MCFAQRFSCKTQSCFLGIRTLIFTGTSMSASHESRLALVHPLSDPGAPSAVALHKEQGSRLSSSASRAVQTAEKRRRNSQQYFSSDLNAVGQSLLLCPAAGDSPRPLLSFCTATDILRNVVSPGFYFQILGVFVNSPSNTTQNLHQKIL